MGALVLIAALALSPFFGLGCLTVFAFIYWKLRKHFSNQTCLIVVLCMLALMVSLMTAPYYSLGGANSYLISVITYVVLVGLGVPKFRRLMLFFKREFDGDPDNDIPVDDAPSSKK